MTGGSESGGYGSWRLTRKRFLAVVLTVAVITSAAGAGTYTLFKDTERTNGSVEAGTLDLVLGSPGETVSFEVSDIEPGANGTERVELRNRGTLAGNLTLYLHNVTNYEGENSEPETDTSPPGDLGDVLRVTIRLQDDAGNRTLYTGTFSDAFNNTTIPTNATLASGQERTLFIEWRLPKNASNAIQGDGVVANYTVELTQSEHQNGTAEPSEPDEGDSETNRTVTANTQRTESGYRITASDADAGTTVTAALPTDRNDVSLQRLNLTLGRENPVDLNVSRISAPSDSPAVTAETTPSVAVHYEVEHPTLSGEDIDGVGFRFRIPKSELGPNATEVSVYRKHDGEWRIQRSELVRETAEAYVVRARTPGLSKFAVVADNGSVRIDHLQSQGIAEYDPYLNRTLNSSWYDRLTRTRANVTAHFIRQAIAASCTGCKALVEPNTRERQALDVLRSNNSTEQKVDELTDIYTNVSESEVFAVAFDYSKRKAVASLEALDEGAARRAKRTLGRASKLATLAEVSAYLGGGVIAGQALGNTYATSLHMNNDGYTHEEYTALRSNLRALSNNSRELENATNTSERERLLDDRKALLNETYHILPGYLDGVHSSLIDNAAGKEDVTAYRQIRRVTESLRIQLLLDYAATTHRLSGESRNLGAQTTMPTHGWTVTYTIEENLREALFGNGSVALSYNLPDSEVDQQYHTTITGNTLPDRDSQFGETVVYDTMDTGDDYAVYRIELDENSLPQDLVVRLARVGRAGEFVGRFDAYLSASPPKNPRQSGGVELADTAREGYSIQKHRRTDASQDAYYLTVTANGSLGSYYLTATTNDTGTQVEVLGRAGPDVQRPHVSLTDGPSATSVDGERVLVSNETEIDLTWDVWDVKTSTGDLTYRYRVANESGRSEWSNNRSVPEDGKVTQSLALSEGYHRVQFVVRDDAGYRTERIVTLKVDRKPPRSTFEVYEQYVTPRAEVQADERVSSVTVQYRPVNETEWRHWFGASSSGTIRLPDINATTALEARARVTDLAGRHSQWQYEWVANRTRERVYTDLQNETNTSGNVTDDTVSVGGGRDRGDGDGDDAGDSSASFSTVCNGCGSGGQTQVKGTVIDGELVMDIYVSSRNVERIRLASVTFTEDERINLTEVVPPNLAGDVRIDFVFRGDGIARIDKVSVQETPPVTLKTSPSPPTAGRETTITAVTDEYNGTVQRIAWDVDDDGTFERVGETVTATFESAGQQDVGLEVVDEAAETSTITTSLVVNGPPTPRIDAAPSVRLGERVQFDGRNSTDDGNITAYEWDVDGDGAFERRGRTVNATYGAPGNRTVRLRVTDDDGARTTENVTVYVNAPPVATLTRPDVVAAHQVTTFSAANSTDSAGSIVRYEWDFDGDGDYEIRGRNVTHAFRDAGNATVSLRVTDDRGASDVVTREVRVSPALAFERLPNFSCRGICRLENETTLVLGGTPAAREVVVEQDGERFEVVPLSNGQTIEEFYNYGNAELNSPLPVAKSDASRLFLWKGPDGLSLVVIHDKPRDRSGGAVSFDFTGLPTASGSWVVQDDGNDFRYYYGGGARSPDWTWNDDNTDGGAFRGGLANRTVTITPAFNDEAERYPITYGTIDEWQILTGQATAPRTISLDMDEPVTLRVPSAVQENESESDGGTASATWNYSVGSGANASEFRIRYSTEQTGDDPRVRVVATGADGRTVNETLTIGTVGTAEQRLDLSELNGTVTVSIETRDVDMRVRVLTEWASEADGS